MEANSRSRPGREEVARRRVNIGEGFSVRSTEAFGSESEKGGGDDEN